MSSLGMRSTLPSLLLFVILGVFFSMLSGQKSYFEQSEVLREAYLLTLDLRLDEAQQMCERSRKTEPDNLLVEHISSYTDFIRAFLSETKEDLEIFEERKKDRIEKIQSGDRTSPYYYYCQAEIHLQWALARSKHKQYFKAGWDINKAYKLLNKCKKEHPDFKLADKSLALIHSLIGSFKGFQRSLVKLFTALDGTVYQGLEEINALATSPAIKTSLWYPEVILVQSLMALHVQRDENSSYEILSQLNEEVKQYALFRYFIGGALQKMGKSNQAKEYLCQTKTDTQYLFDYMTLQCGICLLNELSEEANLSLISYIDNFSGTNYKAEAYQKMAWYYLVVRDSIEGYKTWIAKSVSEGSNLVGEDQQAILEAKSGRVPHPTLLKARLLFDGGYYKTGEEVLMSIHHQDLNPDEILELHYRQGRIAHKLGQYKKAVKSYGQTINKGMHDDIYYACNSALQIAEIFRAQNEYVRAIHYYKMCLGISPKTYKQSLHQKARLGLDAIKGL